MLLLSLALTTAVSIRQIKPASDSQQPEVAKLAAGVSVDEFEAGRFTTPTGAVVRYRLLRPRVTNRRSYPLVVIFHGSGAIGSDNVSQLGPLAKSWATPRMVNDYPAFVLVPQFPARSAVYSGSGAATTSQPTDELRNALALIDEITRTLPIDRKQICAIGFSMGGSAVWNAIALRPRLFSAAVIVSGVPNLAALPKLGRTRLLLVHGDADDENPFTATRAAFDAAPKNRVELWQYERLGHEFPAELIVHPDLARWLFR